MLPGGLLSRRLQRLAANHRLYEASDWALRPRLLQPRERFQAPVWPRPPRLLQSLPGKMLEPDDIQIGIAIRDRRDGITRT